MTLANLVALAAARDRLAGGAASREGLQTLPGQPVVYASEQVHNSVDKAVGLLGIGWNALAKVPVDSGYAMDVDALRAAIHRDREAGRLPARVVATAGRVNTGAIDPLERIAELCAEHSARAAPRAVLARQRRIVRPDGILRRRRPKHQSA